MPQIALLDDYQGVARDFADWSRLPTDCTLTVFRDTIVDLDALVDRLLPFEIIGIMRERTPFPRALFERLPNLKCLVTTGLRNKAIDLEAARDAGVTVCGTPSSGFATSELAWGLILSLLRHIPDEHANMRDGRWVTTVGANLTDLTLGVVGLGRLGSRVCRVARAFEMDVIAWSENLTEEKAAAEGARRVDKETLLKTADVITIHSVLSPRTEGLIGAAELAQMKRSAVIVNTSRGPIVDEAALVAALHAGTIAGAGIDVYGTEPLPADHPLRFCPNVVLTPHIGYNTAGSYRVFYAGMLEAMLAWLDGAPIRVMAPD